MNSIPFSETLDMAYVFSSMLLGMVFIAFYIVIVVFRNKTYLFKDLTKMKQRIGVISFTAGVFFILYGVARAFSDYNIAIILYISIALLGCLAFLSLFNFGKARGELIASREIEEEIKTRLGIEDKLIKKNNQLVWAERTAKICYADWDLRYNKITFSDGAEQVLGFKPQKVNSYDELKAIIIPEDRIKIHRFLETITVQEGITTLTFRIILNGALKYIQMNSEAHDGDNTIQKIRGTFQDITEQQMFITRIKDKNELLKSIAWTQSHDMRGPVASILGLVSLLNEDDFKDTHNKEVISNIKDGAEQLDDMIRKIVKQAQSPDVDID